MMDGMQMLATGLAVVLIIGLLSVWLRRRRSPPSDPARPLQTTRAQPPGAGAERDQASPVPPPASVSPPQPSLESATGAEPADLELDDMLDLSASEDAGPTASVSPAVEPARFSAYYPKEVAPDTWMPLRAYVFRLNAAEAVAKDAADTLKNALTDYRPVAGDSTAPLAEGALITATPDLPGFQFNPPSASVIFFEDWQALLFRLRPTTAPLEQAANGRITFTADGVIVADLPLSVFVTAQPATSAAPAASASADPYDSVFCSYSHKDTAIVERIERAYKALGLDFLRDVTTLRSGEDWNARLLELIDEADIFQLFWSNAAAESKYVRQEWEHALSLKRTGAFIRPVYWEQPMHKAPAELSALHFHFDPTLDDGL